MKIGFLLLVVISVLMVSSLADPVEDKNALLDFINNIHHSRQVNWNNTLSVCNDWMGVACNTDQTRVIALHLPGFGISGPIPENTLSRLTAIQILSLRSNDITGPFPSELAKFENLSALYLQSNKFTGALPLDFFVWKNISVIDLSYNGFDGSIPSSVSNLTQLVVLNLAYNSLSEEIPDLQIPSLQVLNLSYNHLAGPLPQSLRRFPLSAFLGNKIVFGSANSPSPAPALSLGFDSPTDSGKKIVLGEHLILGVIVGCIVLAFVMIAVVMVLCQSKKGDGVLPVVKSKKKDVPVKKGVSESQNENNKLIFFEGCNLAFDLEDLLRASAEVLGKGTLGTTYKAALEDTNTMVVKRLKEGGVGKREFEEQMELVGNIRHENVAALRAYFFSKEEKLVIYDYFCTGSVSEMLHGMRGDGVYSLDWETRLRVAVGAARGIAHIHSTNGGKVIHGNIKSSNIFINSEGFGCVCDIGLSTLNPTPLTRVRGYRAPEVTDTLKATHASDVYSFGVLLLELLTGKNPTTSPTNTDEVFHLVRWVKSVIHEEWTAEVFDLELLKYPNIEEEMVELLQVGMTCTARMPEDRPKMAEVVKMVSDIRRMSTRPSSAGPKSELSTPNPLIAETASSSLAAK